MKKMIKKQRKNRNYTIGRMAGVPSFNIRGKFLTNELGLDDGDKVTLRHDLDTNKLIELYQQGELLVFQKLTQQEKLRQENEQRLRSLKKEMLVCQQLSRHYAT